MDRDLQEFLNQSWKSLLRLDTAVGTLESGTARVGALERILGVMRAIRDQAASLGLENLENLTASSTSLLQRLRTGMSCGHDTISVVLEAIEGVKESIVELEATGQESATGHEALIARLDELAGRDLVPQPTRQEDEPADQSIRLHTPTQHPMERIPTREATSASDVPAGMSYLVSPRVPDHLMELVDALNTARNRLGEARLERGHSAEDSAKIEEIDRITVELQETVATIWLQPTVADTVRRHSSASRQELPRSSAASTHSNSQYDTLHRLPAIGPDTLNDLSVLVVDNSLFFRQLAIAALEAAGCKVAAVKDTSIALELIGRGEHFDAVLVDVESPDIQQRELSKARTDKLRVPLIGLLSATIPIEASRINKAGFDRCVAKYHTRQMIAAIDDLCRNVAVRPGACA